jgi:hypothetical protein
MSIMTNVTWTAAAGFLVCAGIAPAGAQAPSTSRLTAEQKDSRYQIGVLERVLEGAVEHGVTNIRDRLQTIGPTELLISENATARGFRLDGYGVFFDVVVPSFNTNIIWATRTLDQNDLGLDSALKALQAHIQAAGDPSLQQALRRVELQVAPAVQPRPAPAATARNAAGAVAVEKSGPESATAQPVDPILSDPDEAYRKEVVTAVMDAMLEHSSALAIGPAEWLTVAARRNEERPRLAPADTDTRTIVIRLKGSDLNAFLARQISKDEALQRFEVRVF